MLLNLLKNAIQHTPAGGQIRVEVNFVSDSDSQANPTNMINVTVEDTGVGITDREMLLGKGEAMF